MSSTWGRLAVVVITALAFAACQASPSIPECGSETDVSLAAGVVSQVHQETWTDPIPGTKALFGLYQRHLDVGRRDCLSNGSNYCFGNDVDYCPSCGNCCVEGKHCCATGKVCCGGGCCPSDQTCSEGKCLPPVVPITVTSTIFQTITHIATQRATIVIVQIEESTAISTIQVTISTAATQTNVVWTTVTAVAKRATASTHPPQLRGRNAVLVTRKGLPQVLRDVAAIPRQEIVPTVTEYVTQIVDVTSISSILITAHTTSTTMTTVYQTNTQVLQAETTITITSTLTFTSRSPSIVTLTTTASLIPPSTSTPNPLAPPITTETSRPQPLPTPAIAGIAAGSSVLALLLAGFIILSIRRQHRAASSRHDDTSPPFFGADDDHHHHYRPDTSETLSAAPRSPYHAGRIPTLPKVLPHFASSPPAHHAVEYRLPVTTPPTPDGHGGVEVGGARSAGGAGEADYLNESQGGHHHHHHHHHQRNSSGYTTLVGTPSPTVAGFGFAPAEQKPLGIAEMQGSRPASPRNPPRSQERRVWWVEVDGRSPAAVASPAAAAAAAAATASPARTRLRAASSSAAAAAAAAFPTASMGARQRASSSPTAISPYPLAGSGSPRSPGRGYPTRRGDSVVELEGDEVVGELEGDGGRRL